MALQLRPELAVGAVVQSAGELLLVRRANEPESGVWSLPGGRLEWGETLQEAVVREVLEETSVEIVCGAFIDWVERHSPDHHFVIMEFWGQVTGADVAIPGSDAAESLWVSTADLSDVVLAEGLTEFLADHGIIDTIV